MVDLYELLLIIAIIVSCILLFSYIALLIYGWKVTIGR